MLLSVDIRPDVFLKEEPRARGARGWDLDMPTSPQVQRLHGDPKWRHAAYKAIGRVWRLRDGAEKEVIQVFVRFSDPYSALFAPNFFYSVLFGFVWVK